MKSWSDLCAQAMNFHPESSLDELLGQAPLRREELLVLADDRIFSTLTRRIFRAGLKHSLVDAKWPAFEEAFYHFNPEAVQEMSDEMLEGLMQNDQIIRHFGKIKATRANAMLMVDLAQEYGSVAKMIADWPEEEIVELWALLKKRGKQLGGNSAAYFLRMLGKDTFMLTDDVVTALKAQGVIDKKPTAHRDLIQVQSAFNQLREQSGKPLCQISRLLAHSIGQV
ncbi:DNA-3-methyladenine glycosylase I [Marinobacterium sediminicola]|uniref:DNA-3-methyladenine glycosylase I n=1 Tax=Marinobacterium sediminicola TaxID=518898 RepID=A0ABY1RYW7_9GAMM|nr:DNA-3-methyladenine glycosylase I [Marinobacterium sediminicola]ULG67968.1 DNA-3-methyladenine glycosylase I [Marinobacterium sediminicola]SMR73524.1 DNA-3-methyladenine glycosylase I [Marinobacterium sediminicola]